MASSSKEHAPYSDIDPDRLYPPQGESDWGCEEFQMKWYNDDDLFFQNALHAQDNDHPGSSSAEDRYGPGRPICRASPHKRAQAQKPRKDIVREGWAHQISRWPLLTIIGVASLFEFLVYVSVRQMVRLFEKLMSWRAQEGRLRRKLQAAENYEEWKQAALELDDLLGFEQWKRNSINAYYDSTSVRRVVASLERLRVNNDAEDLMGVLEVCLRANFAGIESIRLYSQTHLGTKTLIENYVDEVEKSLVYIRETSRISPQEKAIFFRRTAKSLGTTALCLSGGATFGFYHFGVLRALLDAGLMPTVITGTSAGALVASFLCTHTDEELDRFLVPELADMITACEDPISVWLPRLIRTGARFDTVLWAKKSSFFTRGSMTFKEAYERTGRILNVSVTPHDVHSPTTLLNYTTAPNCVIFSAILASAAVPLILNPVVLLEKSKMVKLDLGNFKYYNTSFSIVSQVNPHVHLFFFQPRGAPGQPVTHRKGKGWRGGFFLSALEQFVKLELVKNLRVIRDLELLPLLGGQTFTAVFLQRFEGTVTIWPRSRLWDWFNLLTDPDRKELARMIDVGKRVTWPKIRMIENRLRIERQVFMGRQETRRSQESGIAKAQSQHGKDRRAEGSLDEGGTISGTDLHGSPVYRMDSDIEIPQFSSPDVNLRQLRMARDRRDLNRRLSLSSKSCQLLDSCVLPDEAAVSSAGEDISHELFKFDRGQSVMKRTTDTDSDSKERTGSFVTGSVIED
ncbi:hypothetical protein PSHT_04015 [Puccinia striiformis]|uniref:Patatin-like phospholipase domain-containing protein n=1 Tax=Puccinia striiformis TaxID=27350 RepID=A0A2S4WE38_9BASI|nr:hypothetical protein PSHT_04015 [Puccinia striiformis]